MNKSGCVRLFILFGLLAGIIFILIRCISNNEIKLQSEIDRISARWVPDKRVGICNIKLKYREKGKLIITGESTIPQAKIDIIKTLDKQIKLLTDSIIILPDTIENRKYMGLVTLSVINLRREPDHASELVSQARLGTPVLILKNNNSWMLVQTPDNYISWTEASSVKQMTRIEILEWQKAARVIYMDNTGWLYSSASDNSGVVGDLVGGSIMEKTGELNGFVSVVLPDGRKGYVEKKKVMDFNSWKSTVPCTNESICKTALTFTGLPYLWGGSSAKAVDCSGFVQSVYFMNGLILQRDASLQALHGSEVDISVDYSRLKKGDLLFFGSQKDGKSRVTHVAIYMGGNNDYINASSRVMINSLDSAQSNYNGPRKKALLMAKRIIGVENDLGIVPVNKHPWY